MTEITLEDTIEMMRDDREDWFDAERLIELSERQQIFIIQDRRAKE